MNTTQSPNPQKNTHQALPLSDDDNAADIQTSVMHISQQEHLLDDDPYALQGKQPVQTETLTTDAHVIKDGVADVGVLYKQPNPIPPKTAIDITLDLAGSLADNAALLWQTVLQQLKSGYLTLASRLTDEILIRISQQQVNDALHRFITQNVQMLHDLHLDIHDDWLRLYATVDIMGIFARVACNLRVVQIQLDGETQRLVFEQLSNTDILQLYSKKWYQAPAARLGVSLYRGVLRKDPLPFILQKIKVKNEPFATHKGRFIYLDIHRYLKGQPKILSYLTKAQINDGHTLANNLLLNVQINFGELVRFGESGEDIISDEDDPKQQKVS